MNERKKKLLLTTTMPLVAMFLLFCPIRSHYSFMKVGAGEMECLWTLLNEMKIEIKTSVK